MSDRPGVVHWDAVRATTRTFEGIASTWRDLGRAAGTRGIGLRRIDMPAGGRATPPHAHAAEEEIFWVLSGWGTLWLAGATCPIRTGDAIVFRPGPRPHTVIAGADGMDILAFGERRTAELCHLPRAGMGWLGNHWVDVPGDGPFVLDERAGPLEVPAHGERPASVVHVDDVPVRVFGKGDVERHGRDLGRAAGSRATGLNHARVAAGMLAAPPHCHAAEEELFVVLGGSGELLLDDDAYPLAPGDIVSRPPGTGVAHTFRGGPDGLELLLYGTREPHDMTFYPRSGKVAFRGLGVIGRLEQLDYWDGEV